MDINGRRKLWDGGNSLEEVAVAAFPNRVKSVLYTLKSDLQNSPSHNNSEISQLNALDPGGDVWSRFEEMVNIVRKSGRKEKWTPLQSKLHRDLINANIAQDFQTEMKRIMHFAYIDLVLKSSNPKNESTSKKEADLRYPTEWYTEARANQRTIHLHVGPTNSGKTYNALKRLEEAKSGFYAGPLRLLAHEVYSRLNAKGLPCDLVTGDDVRLSEGGAERLYASTVEMVDVTRRTKVAVIDEIQMMASEERGWAWTRAFLGVNADEVHLCGESRVVPLIRELAASIGDTLHIHTYERLSPLKVMSRSLRGNLQNLRKGDCVVCFTVVGLHALKKEIEVETGRRVAIVYGSLPPEIRAQQAAFFNDPNNDYDYLVASDAIGMGLNLNIKRIIFDKVHKFNGISREQLSVPQIKQIAGRAGRFRSAYQDIKSQGTTEVSGKSRASSVKNPVSIGLVTCLDEADLPIIQAAMDTEPAPIRKAGILPPGNLLESYIMHLPEGLPFEYVLQRLCDQASMHPRFALCNIRDQLKIARVIEPVTRLTAAQRFMICAAPAQFRGNDEHPVLKVFAQRIANQKAVTIADIPEIPLEILDERPSGEKLYLDRLESLHKSLILYLWLSYRFVNIFKDQAMANHAKGLVEEKINTCLLEFSANPNLRRRLLHMRKTAVTRTPKPEDDERKVEHVEEKMVEDGIGVEEADEVNNKRDNVLRLDWSKRDTVNNEDMISSNAQGEGQHVHANG